jgi:N-carbamoyl-L-amino-acid hydrolase
VTLAFEYSSGVKGLDVGLELARKLFDEIGQNTFDGVGITRAAYGAGEQLAHDRVAEVARALKLQVRIDAALNLSMTMIGTDASAPSLIIGSHLDSVPQGGNYDGLAGVLAGLSCLAALRSNGIVLRGDVTVMAFRGEENAWFAAQHIGSRAALGQFDPKILDDAKRIDTGKSLASHMMTAGADLTAIRSGVSLLDQSSVGAYLELHIEQGPILEQQAVSVGVVTSLRGNIRFRNIVCLGEYAHSGVVPRALRHDAVFSMSELVSRMDKVWEGIEAEGGDLVVTFGQFLTDACAHGVTTIPGEATLCFDARSHSKAVLDRVLYELKKASRDIEQLRGVSITFSPMTHDAPIDMDRRMQDQLLAGCKELGITSIPITGGAGHDAGDFATAGIPSAMIFVRNQNGSHNPSEAMRFEDFAEGVRLMDWFIRRFQQDD